MQRVLLGHFLSSFPWIIMPIQNCRTFSFVAEHCLHFHKQYSLNNLFILTEEQKKIRLADIPGNKCCKILNNSQRNIKLSCIGVVQKAVLKKFSTVTGKHLSRSHMALVPYKISKKSTCSVFYWDIFFLVFLGL